MFKSAYILIWVSLITLYSCQSESIHTTSVDHSAWSNLLNKHVNKTGEVDYQGFKTDLKKLDTYLQMLSKVKVSNLPKNEQLAFWINAYNAFTIDVVVRNYPLKSIKDIRNARSLIAKATGGSQVWLEKVRYSLDGSELSLFNIEHNKLLRSELFDPRIHFLINCASQSCPKLLNKAYTSENLPGAMEQMAREFINDPAKNRVTADQIQVSEIFNWYDGHFTREGTLISYLNKYSVVRINENARISYLPYNWDLNGE